VVSRRVQSTSYKSTVHEYQSNALINLSIEANISQIPYHISITSVWLHRHAGFYVIANSS